MPRRALAPYFRKNWKSYLKRVQAEYDRITKATPPKPKPPAGTGIYSVSLDVRSYNANGARTYKSCVDLYAKRRLASGLDVLNMQEVDNGISRKEKLNARMRSRSTL